MKKKKAKKMTAILEVTFKPDIMFDEQSIRKEHNNNWTEAMKYLFEQEGFGIFDDEIKLVRVRK